jgi:hypothetical protein
MRVESPTAARALHARTHASRLTWVSLRSAVTAVEVEGVGVPPEERALVYRNRLHCERQREQGAERAAQQPRVRPAWLGRPKRSVVHFSHLKRVRGRRRRARASRGLGFRVQGSGREGSGSAAHVVAGAVLVGPADEFHRRALHASHCRHTTQHSAARDKRHLQVVADAVGDRGVLLRTAHQQRYDAPQGGAVGLDEGESERQSAFKSCKTRIEGAMWSRMRGRGVRASDGGEEGGAADRLLRLETSGQRPREVR